MSLSNVFVNSAKGGAKAPRLWRSCNFYDVYEPEAHPPQAEK
jgi:hypothetical protein